MYYELDEKIINLIKSGNIQEALDELQKIESTDERIQTCCYYRRTYSRLYG